MAISDKISLTEVQKNFNLDSLILADSSNEESDGKNQQDKAKFFQNKDISTSKNEIEFIETLGGGKRVTMKALSTSNEEINILMDSQSSATLIKETTAKKHGYQLLRSKIPVRMEGLFGSEIKKPNYCLVKLKVKRRRRKNSTHSYACLCD